MATKEKDDPLVPPRGIAEEATELIYGDREGTYGNPAKNLRAIADFWQVYLYNLTGTFYTISTDDVCNMLVLMKTARLINAPLHRDSLVDVIGYTLLKERIAQTQGEGLK